MRDLHRTLACLLFVLLLFSSAAQAHPGHTGGLGAGFAHPFSGFDHLLTMIVVGIWAAQLGGRARWGVPLAFVSMMMLGAALALDGIVLPAVDTGITLSLFVLGLVVASARRVPSAAAAALAAAFALFHGAAHGVELPGLADPRWYGVGFIVATLCLHGFGVFLGAFAQRHLPIATRMVGAATAVAGIALFMT
jgi:urease accessory protein